MEFQQHSLASGPSLPDYALYPSTALLFCALIYAVWRIPHLSGRFLTIIVWLRFVMQGFHQFTFAPAVGGASWNAVVSFAVVILGLFICGRRLHLLGRIPAFFFLIAVISISALLNLTYAGWAESLIKWSYFAVVLCCLFDWLQRAPADRVFSSLLWAFAPPLCYQALSVFLGISKATEDDGSVSFIGGFNHEAVFSIVLITGFFVVTRAKSSLLLTRTGLLALIVVGLVLANYRTSLIALVPMAVASFAFGSARFVRPRERGFVTTIFFLFAAAAIVAAAWQLRERFQDLAYLNENILKPPSDFNIAERQAFSGRAYLWSVYLDAYLRGNTLQLLFGFGPDSWETSFGIYAHNTFISYLYEYGALGVTATIWLFVAMFVQSNRIATRSVRLEVQTAHISFLILNLATMPLWQIEGVVFYGLLCGWTLASAVQKRRDARSLRARSLRAPIVRSAA